MLHNPFLRISSFETCTTKASKLGKSFINFYVSHSVKQFFKRELSGWQFAGVVCKFLLCSRLIVALVSTCFRSARFSPHAVTSGDTLIRGPTPDWFFAGFLPATCPWCDKSNYHGPAARPRDGRKERPPSHTPTRAQSRYCPKHAHRPSHLDCWMAASLITIGFSHLMKKGVIARLDKSLEIFSQHAFGAAESTCARAHVCPCVCLCACVSLCCRQGQW